MQVETTLKLGEAQVTVDRKMGRHIQTLGRIPGYLAAIISFKTQQVMLGSTWNKMIAVFAIGIPACVVGGVMYSLASGRDIVTGFIQAYGALYKIPGEHMPWCQCDRFALAKCQCLCTFCDAHSMSLLGGSLSRCCNTLQPL